VTTTSSGLGIQPFDERSPRAAELLRELHDGVFLPSFRLKDEPAVDDGPPWDTVSEHRLEHG
jgi:hypothetical protein